MLSFIIYVLSMTLLAVASLLYVMVIIVNPSLKWYAFGCLCFTLFFMYMITEIAGKKGIIK